MANRSRSAGEVGAAILIAALVAGCGGGGLGNECESRSDCPEGELCLDNVCVPAEGPADGDADADGDTERPDGGDGDADGDGEDGGGCPTAIVCGSPPACCSASEECIEGACMLECPSGVRCGEGLAACCAAGEVCIDRGCVAPGDGCTDSFDCAAGEFCEPTLGQCLPQFDPITCETTPVFGPFEVVEEWSVTEPEEAPDCRNPISAPVVVDLDGDAVPEVVCSFACDDTWERGVLRAFSGVDGRPLWSATDAAEQLNGRSSIAAGDLTGDGLPEIVAAAPPARGTLLAFSPTGEVLWESHDADGEPYVMPLHNGAPTLADLDGDGSPEIVCGATVLDSTGLFLWARGAGPAEGTNGTYSGGISVVADIDLDTEPEIVAGRNAYEGDGTPKWTIASDDGYPAVADFDADPQPEVVLVASGFVLYADGLTGDVEWGPVALPGGGIGGPPTVADFDGDGLPEIGVAGAGSYTVYDPDGPEDILWSMETQDNSSNATGSSVFDFEGDGAAEVVYGDECYTRVYRGSDGLVLLQIPSTSATIHEYPLVVDVDADGNSEIVIVANAREASITTQCLADDPDYDGERQGIFVYGDAADQWLRTRRIWNQHAYHVTNITPSGTIPAVEANNWELSGLNNYRQNVQGEGAYNAPDLKVLALEVDLRRCPENARLAARITNEGNLGAPEGVPVAFRAGTPGDPGELLGVVNTTVPLLPGASTVVELEVPLDGFGPFDFVATVDADEAGVGIVAECDELDNAEAIAEVTCDILG